MDKIQQKFKTLGKNIQKMREERKLSSKDISLKSKIRVQYLKKIENWTPIRMMLSHFIQIIDALDIEILDLF